MALRNWQLKKKILGKQMDKTSKGHLNEINYNYLKWNELHGQSKKVFKRLVKCKYVAMICYNSTAVDIKFFKKSLKSVYRTGGDWHRVNISHMPQMWCVHYSLLQI